MAENVIQKVVPTPILVEIIGEPAVGKTHLASLFPSPYLIDTTPKGESRSVFLKVMADRNMEGLSRYAHVKSWSELLKAVDGAVKGGIKTIIIDSSSELQDMVKDYYLEEHPNRKNILQVEYGKIRDTIDIGLTYKVTSNNMNLVLTSQMKTAYKQVQTPDGNIKAIPDGRARDGYTRLDFQSDIRLHLTLDSVDKCAKCGGDISYVSGLCMNCNSSEKKKKWRRRVKVVKNRFRDMSGNDWIDELREPSWEEIKKLVVLTPYEILVE